MPNPAIQRFIYRNLVRRPRISRALDSFGDALNRIGIPYATGLTRARAALFISDMPIRSAATISRDNPGNNVNPLRYPQLSQTERIEIVSTFYENCPPERIDKMIEKWGEPFVDMSLDFCRQRIWLHLEYSPGLLIQRLDKFEPTQELRTFIDDLMGDFGFAAARMESSIKYMLYDPNALHSWLKHLNMVTGKRFPGTLSKVNHEIRTLFLGVWTIMKFRMPQIISDDLFKTIIALIFILSAFTEEGDGLTASFGFGAISDNQDFEGRLFLFLGCAHECGHNINKDWLRSIYNSYNTLDGHNLDEHIADIFGFAFLEQLGVVSPMRMVPKYEIYLKSLRKRKVPAIEKGFTFHRFLLDLGVGLDYSPTKFLSAIKIVSDNYAGEARKTGTVTEREFVADIRRALREVN